MADMRPPGPDAGRRGLLCAAGAGLALLGACSIDLRELAPESGQASSRPEPPGDILHPLAVVQGGFTLAPSAVMGIWQPPPGPFLALIRPLAAAFRGADLYIADAGHGAIFHYDLQRQTLRRFLSVAAQPGIRMCVLEDQTLLVLEPFRRRLTRMNREGVTLMRLQDPAFPAGALHMAYEQAGGVIWLNDGSGAQLVAMQPALNAMVPLPLSAEDGGPVGPVADIAVGPQGGLFALDGSRQRILRLDRQGRVQQVIGEMALKLPRSLAVDRYRRVYVLDVVGIQVFANGRPLQTLTARDLGCMEITDVSIHEDDLVLADAAGARLHLFRIRPREGGW